LAPPLAGRRVGEALARAGPSREYEAREHGPSRKAAKVHNAGRIAEPRDHEHGDDAGAVGFGERVPFSVARFLLGAAEAASSPA